MNTKYIAIFVAALALGGCAKAPVKPALTETDPVVRALDEAAMRVARAAEQAALSQSISNKRNGVTEEYKLDLSRVPREMREPLLLEGGFNGEFEVFLKSLTDAIGWPQPIVLGSKPSTPLLVTFTEQRRPPALFVADAGYQAGAMADVTINSSLKQIIIRYREAGGTR